MPNGVPVGSDTANLSILGYPPERYYTGRAPLEALGLGMHMNKNDIVLRANLVTLRTEAAAFSQCVLLDHSADEISTDEAAILMDVIRGEFENSDISFHTGTGYRHLLCWHNGALPVLAQPHDHLGEPIGAYLPQQPLLRELMYKIHVILDRHPVNQARQARGLHKANGLWFWGAGTPVQLPPFREQTGKRGVMVSATDLLHGIAAGIGLESVPVSGADGSLHTNFTGKAMAAVQALREGADFAFVHLEAPDEMGHQGDAQRKMQAISSIDQQVIATVFRAGCGGRGVSPACLAGSRDTGAVPHAHAHAGSVFAVRQHKNRTPCAAAIQRSAGTIRQILSHGKRTAGIFFTEIKRTS